MGFPQQRVSLKLPERLVIISYVICDGLHYTSSIEWMELTWNPTTGCDKVSAVKLRKLGTDLGQTYS